MALITFKQYFKENQNISEAVPLAAAAASGVAQGGSVLARIGPAISTMSKSPQMRNAASRIAASKGVSLGKEQSAQPEKPVSSRVANEPLELLGVQSVAPPTAKVFSGKGVIQPPQNQQIGGSIKSNVNVTGTFSAAQQPFMRNLYGTGLQGR